MSAVPEAPAETLPPLARPETCLPPCGVADLPEPEGLSWRHWTRFVGPGIVMMGVQIGGGEWLFGPEITARYGGGLLWIASVAIIVQVFYNLECGRYALYCGEPILTGFMRLRPGPAFWATFFLLLNIGAMIPGLASHGGAVLASLALGRPAGVEDRPLVMGLAYACLVLVVVPVFFGGRVYNTLQAIMSAKVMVVLGFSLAMSLFFVGPQNWWNILSGFGKFGTVPVSDGRGGEVAVNLFTSYWADGKWPAVSLANIAVLGAFAGYAGGGGLGNSLYSNFVRDKGWGMGSLVGAIPSAVGGRNVTLSHLGTVFPADAENLRRWKGWWKYVFVDQVFVWAPGCFVGMALPALMSLEFAPHSALYREHAKLDWAQAVIAADGARYLPGAGPALGGLLWTAMLFVGLMVLLPSQMSVVDEVSRRWTDVLWSASPRVRGGMAKGEVKYIYYTILCVYVVWCVTSLYLFTNFGTPKLMTMVIANIGNVSIGFTALQILHVNTRFLPAELRPRWYNRAGLVACAVFYLGMAGLVFVEKQWPVIRGLFVS
ncbi:MAG: Nramp family divalent metal transporter [Isosphaeraceae bacterium]